MYILAVDDERLALDTLVNELKTLFPSAHIHQDLSPMAAADWAEALARQGESLDYAFIDIRMRGISGLDLARRLKSFHPLLKLFFCTAHSEHAFDAFGLYAKGYLLKPIRARDIERVLDEMVVEWRLQADPSPRSIRIQTFGHFEVFIDNAPLYFEREKAKELLAFLVDRHGSSVTTEQISVTLWEDIPYSRRQKNITTAVVSSLRNTLKEAGIEDILIKTWNHLAIDVSKIKCDAYEYEQGDLVAINSFRGEYLTNYSWAEFTTAKYAQMKQD